MPLYKKIELPEATIGLWRIEEDIAFFQSKFPPVAIANESKRLQWYATRNLLNELCGKECEVIKLESGKPVLKDSSHHISISHTAQYAAVIVCEKNQVGVDLELVNPKVERIAHKFLYPEEIAAIRPEQKIEKMILYWSVKEALYKLYGHRNVEFMTQLLVEPFELKTKEVLDATINTESVNEKLKVHYEFLDGHVLSYVVGR